MRRGSHCLSFALAAVALLSACTSADDAEPTAARDHTPDDPDALDDGISAATSELEAPALATAAVRHVYGASVQGRDLVYYKIIPPSPNGKKAFLTFAVHGFEDAWKQDGRALTAIANKAIAYYGADPAKLKGWTLYIVPTANPDGTLAGKNNFRETVAGAFGRCTSTGDDINRHVSQGTSFEQRKLKALFDDIGPTIAIDFHGWFNTYYGNSHIGGFFSRAFNAAYTGKPAKYCFVSAAGALDCGPTLGGIFHASTSISTDLFAEWATRVRGVPAALVEYPAPDFNLNGLFDTVWDDALGYRRIGNTTLQKLYDRTQVALNDLFANY